MTTKPVAVAHARLSGHTASHAASQDSWPICREIKRS